MCPRSSSSRWILFKLLVHMGPKVSQAQLQEMPAVEVAWLNYRARFRTSCSNVSPSWNRPARAIDLADRFTEEQTEREREKDMT